MIMHVLKVGCRWVDCPKAYGPHKTIYNRFARWSERGIWQKIFESVAASSEPPEQAWWWASAIAGLSLRPG
jgi:transposase